MSREQLQRAALEMAVIVFGILLALGAEAAWQERGERQREVQILSDLLEEFRSNDARLTADIVQNKQASADAALWAEVMLGERSVSADSAMTLLDAAQWDARFDPVTGALRSLVDGGELGLIQNPELRRVLAGWGDRVAEARMTTNSYDDQRQRMFATVLAFPTDRPIEGHRRNAVLLAAQTSGYQNIQLEPLLIELRAIAGMIEGELERWEE